MTSTGIAIHLQPEARVELRNVLKDFVQYGWVEGDSLLEAEPLIARGQVRLLLLVGSASPVEYACLARVLTADSELSVLVSRPELTRTAVSMLVPAFVQQHLSTNIMGLDALPAELARRGTKVAAHTAADFEGVMGDLRDKYAESLDEKVTVVQLLLQAGASDEQLAAARMRVHKLRGSAALFGHKALGTAAGLVEDCLLEYMAHGHGWDNVTSALEHLAATAARVSEKSTTGQSHSQAFRAGSLLYLDADGSLFERLRKVGGSIFLEVIRISRPEEAVVYAADRKVLAAVLGIHGDSERTARALRASVGDERLMIALACSDVSDYQRPVMTDSRHVVFFSKSATDHELAQVLRTCSAEDRGPRHRVMVVDDDQDFSSYVEALLNSMDVEVALLSSAENLLQAMEEWGPDLVLLDIVMPGASGVELCRVLRRFVRWHHTPIMLVTGRVTDEVRLEAYRAGASDFVSKPLIPEELVARVRVRLEHNRLLREYAEQDNLSGLWLRRPLLDAAHRMLAHAKRNQETVAIALIDLDCFKAINDTRGHTAGDEVIAGLGRLIRARLRVSDLKCRWGGEEFLLVFDGTSSASAKLVVESLLESFRAIDFGIGTGALFRATFSAGVADTSATEHRFESMLESADRALYRAKREGRARACEAEKR